jgi:hypothetical protein
MLRFTRLEWRGRFGSGRLWGKAIRGGSEGAGMTDLRVVENGDGVDRDAEQEGLARALRGISVGLRRLPVWSVWWPTLERLRGSLHDALSRRSGGS